MTTIAKLWNIVELYVDKVEDEWKPGGFDFGNLVSNEWNSIFKINIPACSCSTTPKKNPCLSFLVVWWDAGDSDFVWLHPWFHHLCCCFCCCDCIYVFFLNSIQFDLLPRCQWIVESKRLRSFTEIVSWITLPFMQSQAPGAKWWSLL